MTIQQSETDWRETLASGDIVNFMYPSSEDDDAIEKLRPCLILEVDADTAEAVVAYGTATQSRANVGHEIRINNPIDLDAASLRKPTRFVGARHLRVSLSSKRFVKSRDGSVRIGRLPPPLHERLDRVKELLRTPPRRVRSPFHRGSRRRGDIPAPHPSHITQESL